GSVSPEMQEALQVVHDFLDDQGDPWEWGDFLSLPTADPNVARLQGFCRELPTLYPPNEKTAYCNERGMERLRSVLNDIEGKTQ
ncbi:MAG: hypothetical protein ABFD86_01245, partial [Bryobacteraceae bacterium]